MRTRRPAAPPALLLLMLATALRATQAQDRVVPNDNRAAAGVLARQVLRVNLVARHAMWHPAGDTTPGARMQAFAEEGGPARIPGPFLRVPAGTAVQLNMRNALPDTLRVHGFFSRVRERGAPTPLVLAPGEVRSVSFQLDVPGTYFYWGTSTGRPISFRTGEDSQLTGVIVVDPPVTARTRPRTTDRFLVVGMWSDTVHRAGTERQRVLGVVNGRSWPATERLTYTQGDTVRWHVINGSADVHPMHLHGTYFRVTRRGDIAVDSAAPPRAAMPSGDLAVTESLLAGQSALLEWIAERPGNWLFHCHVAEHFERRGPLGVAATAGGMSHAHAEGGMGGLVMGLTVRPRRGVASTRRAPAVGERQVRLLVRNSIRGSDSISYFNYAVQHGDVEPPPDTGLVGAPPLDLVKGEPVRITVVNRLREATAVHWHGIELDSYYDGVPGFSGMGRQITPLIAPGDSFVVHFTPPRAGTFIYHTHADEVRQQAAGLVGALVVREHLAPRDTATDIPFVLTSPLAIAETRRALVNGSLAPAPLTMEVGRTYRLRFIQMSVPRAAMSVVLRHGDTVATWRPVAKDGADLPADAQREVEARVFLGVGETGDFAFTPGREGEFTLQVYNGGLLGATPGGPDRRAAQPLPVSVTATVRILVR